MRYIVLVNDDKQFIYNYWCNSCNRLFAELDDEEQEGFEFYKGNLMEYIKEFKGDFSPSPCH